jgi:hypothetical protein
MIPVLDHPPDLGVHIAVTHRCCEQTAECLEIPPSLLSISLGLGRVIPVPPPSLAAAL